MKKLIIIFILLLPIQSFAGDWSTSDTAREIVWQSLHYVDWQQTLTIAKNPLQYNETNPILGRHPSVDDVRTYMAITAFLHLGISYALPEKYRDGWQWLTIGMTGSAVARNYNVGIRFSF